MLEMSFPLRRRQKADFVRAERIRFWGGQKNGPGPQARYKKF